MIRDLISKVGDMLFGPNIEPRWYVSRLSERDALPAQIIVASERQSPLPEFFHGIASRGANFVAFNVAWNMWGAFSADGELIGVVLFTEVAGAKNIDLVDLVVLPAWRGLGVGSALLAKALERAEETDRFVTGMFRSRDFTGLRWLKNRGFTVMRCGDRPLIVDDLFGPGVDGYGMAHTNGMVHASDCIVARIAE
jgi:ribosomal protein S18 acetylase RimI-like enzyme